MVTVNLFLASLGRGVIVIVIVTIIVLNFFFFLKCVVQAGLKLQIHLPQPPKCWDGRRALMPGSSFFKIILIHHLRQRLQASSSYY